MFIGIDASRAFLKNRTGIEEYSYQIIKHLRNKLADQQTRVVLYLRPNQAVDFDLPENWKIKIIKWPRFWTQLGLSLELLLRPVDALLVPAHTVPIIHPARNASPLFNNAVIWWIRKFFNSEEDWNYAHSLAGVSKNTIVVVHGLEYEFCPQAYSWAARLYMRWTIKKSCKWASKIISVSKNTKRDLMRLYDVPEEKITVIYEGYEENFEFLISNSESNIDKKTLKSNVLEFPSELISKGPTEFNEQNSKFLLFIGRIEQRKNIGNIVKAFEILKEKYDIQHKLVLAGRPGYGYADIRQEILNSKFKEDIYELGYISEQKKWELLKKAEVFLFPTQYEGFGIPILEAQSVSCPVVASDNSSIPEVVCDCDEVSSCDELSALLVDHKDPQDISKNIYRLLSEEDLKNAIITKGLKNIRRFSWDKCANEIAHEINGIA